MIDRELLEILACPVCKGQIRYDAAEEKLTCGACGRRYPIRENIPIMLEEEAERPKGTGNRQQGTAGPETQ